MSLILEALRQIEAREPPPARRGQSASHRPLELPVDDLTGTSEEFVPSVEASDTPDEAATEPIAEPAEPIDALDLVAEGNDGLAEAQPVDEPAPQAVDVPILPKDAADAPVIPEDVGQTDRLEQLSANSAATPEETLPPQPTPLSPPQEDAIGRTASRTPDDRQAGFHQLAVNLLAQLPSRGPAVVLFTSPADGMGTTSTLAPLAAVLAERLEGGVLAVDANLHHPQLAAQFGVAVRQGLSAVLSGTVRWQEAVRATSLDELRVLPASGQEATQSSLDGPSMRSLLEELRRHFRLVLVDAPSLGRAEVARLAAACDGTCLVARLGRTTRRRMETATAQIEQHGGRLLGCVVTGTPST